MSPEVEHRVGVRGCKLRFRGSKHGRGGDKSGEGRGVSRGGWYELRDWCSGEGGLGRGKPRM